MTRALPALLASLVLGAAHALPAPPPVAALRFATSYGNHMVLQQAPQQAVVWGHCGEASCANVKLSLRDGAGLVGQPLAAQAGAAAGTWIAKLPATAGSATAHTVEVTDGSSKASLTDVLFGDVWVCSGQSNMAFLLQNAFNGSTFVNESAAHPLVRMFTSKKTRQAAPLYEQPQPEEAWAVSSPCAVSMSDPPCGGKGATPSHDVAVATPNEHTQDDNWLYMSAVCYLYGQAIQAHTGKPVGLVNTNWGGTPVEFWMSPDALKTCDKPDASAAASSASASAWNGMVTPLLNMTIYGAIWYQGESNQGDPINELDPNGLPMARYGCTFPAMIADWRAKWAEGSLGETDALFPFGFVQLAPWINPNNAPAAIRWAQTAGYGHVPNAKMPNVFDAVAFDLTDRTSPYGSVHIRDKKTVGERLALGGRAVAYNDTTVYWQGPTLSGAKLVGQSASLSFANAGAAGLALGEGGRPAFEFCTLGGSANCTLLHNAINGSQPAAGEWSAAVSAHVAGSVLTVGIIGHVPGTVLLRYGWSAVPFEYKEAILSAKAEHLPAGPFLAVLA